MPLLNARFWAVRDGRDTVCDWVSERSDTQQPPAEIQTNNAKPRERADKRSDSDGSFLPLSQGMATGLQAAGRS